jgi:3'(2'), 5'-bisphosphate nucleotidase
VTALGARFPDAFVVAEESEPDAAALTQLALCPRVIYVDPLDGTREFVDGNAEFAVMVGLAVDGRPEAGVIVLPCEGLLVAGRVGQRAFRQDASGVRELLAVSSCGQFADATMMVSRSHRPRLVEPLCRRLGVRKLVPCGSVGVKIARLVLGAAELYVHSGLGLKKWDTCAAEAILLAAGGRLSDLEGTPIDYAEGQLELRRGLLASNSVLHAGVLSAVDWARAELLRVRG